MRRCTYCGKEYGDDVSVCATDGQPVQDSAAPKATRRKPFFRWKPVSVSLIVLAVLYFGAAMLNLLLASAVQQQWNRENSRYLMWGAFWNVAICGLCLVGRHCMKAGNARGRVAGVFAVAAALLIAMRIWLGGLRMHRNPFPILEALLIWPWLIYAIIYAVAEIQKRAEPGAPPSGGPATVLGNSGATERPPSVS